MYSVAIVGATGSVGRQIIDLLAERNFPVDNLSLYASEQSIGDFLDFNDESVPVQPLNNGWFKGVDLAFFCAGSGVSKEHCPLASAAGVVCIDITGAFNHEEDVPLVVPEINPQIVQGRRGGFIVASPCSASIQLSLALHVLRQSAKIERVVVSTYQAVSAIGQRGVDELRTQSGELLNGRQGKNKFFSQQVAFNCVPQVGELGELGYTTEEMNVMEQTRRILSDDSLPLTVTAVTVPVFYGSCQSVNIVTDPELEVEQVQRLFHQAAGIALLDDPLELDYPMPVIAADQDEVFIGRIRRDHSVAGGLNLWSSMDDVRKGSATNSVQIAELVLKETR